MAPLQQKGGSRKQGRGQLGLRARYWTQGEQKIRKPTFPGQEKREKVAIAKKNYEITTSPPQSGIKRTPRELTPAESHRFAPGSTAPAFSVKARFTRSLPGHGAHTHTTGRKRLVAPQRPEKTPDAVPPRPTRQRITSSGGFTAFCGDVTGQN